MPQIYWAARIYKQFTVGVTPRISMATAAISNSAFTVGATPKMGLGVASRDAALGVTITAHIGMAAQGISQAAFTVGATPKITMQRASIGIASGTYSFASHAVGRHLLSGGQQTNVSVNRAATI